MLSWFADWLWGYDFFVSYAHRDGCLEEDGKPRSRYVRSLVQQLRNSDVRFSVFHDETDYDPGTELDLATKRRVRASTKLLLVARPFAMESDWVKREVEQAIKASTEVIVVDINDTFETTQDDNDIRKLIGESRLRYQEYVPETDGTPSTELINKLILASRRSRRDRRRLRIIGATAITLVVLAMAALIFQKIANDQQALRIVAEQNEKTNLALAHLSRGLEAEAAGEIPAAKVHYAKSLETSDSPEARKRLIDNWSTATLRWEVDVSPLLPAVSQSRSSAAESPDRSRLVMGGGTPVVRVSDDDSGSNSGAVRAIEFSSDGTKLLVGTSSGIIKVLNAASGSETAEYSIDDPTTMAVAPSASLVSIGTRSGRVYIYNIDTGEQVRQFRLNSEITALEYDNAGRILAIGLKGMGLRVLDTNCGEMWFRSPPGGHEGTVRSVSFAPSGPEMIWSMGRFLYATDASRDYFQLIAQQDSTISTTSWSKGDALLASAGADGVIQLHRRNERPVNKTPIILSTRRRERPEVRELTGHATGTSVIAFHPDASSLVSGGEDGSVLIWNARRGMRELALPRHKRRVRDLAITRNGELLATVGDDNRLRVWNVEAENGRKIWGSDNPKNSSGISSAWGAENIANLVTNSDGSPLIQVSDGRIWKVSGDEQLTDGGGVMGTRHMMCASPDRSRVAVIVPNMGKRLNILAGGPKIAIHKSNDGKENGNLDVKELSVADWFSDGKSFAIGTKTGHVMLHRIGEQPVAEIASHEDAVVAITAARQAPRIAAAWANGRIEVFDVTTNTSVLFKRVSENPVFALRLDAKGEFLVVATSGSLPDIRVWEVATQKEVLHEILTAESLDFDSTSHFAVGDGRSGELWLFDVANGRALATWKGHSKQVVAVAFGPNDDVLFSAGDDGTVRRWQMPILQELLSGDPSTLLANAEKDSGLTLDNLEHRARSRSAILSLRPSARTDRRSQHERSLSEVAEVAHAINKAKERIAEGQLPPADSEIFRNLLNSLDSVETTLKQMPKPSSLDVVEAQLAVSVQVVRSQLLEHQGNGPEATSILIDAANDAKGILANDDARAWPGAFHCFDRLVDRLIDEERHSEVIRVLGNYASILEELIQQSDPLRPPLSKLGDTYRKLATEFQALGQDDEACNTLANGIEFIRRIREDRPEYESALEGIGHLTSELAGIYVENDRIDDARAALEQAVDAHGTLLERFEFAGEQEQSNRIRNKWAQAMSLLATVMYHEAVALAEPNDENGKQKAIALLKAAEELGERVVMQLQILQQQRALTPETVSTFRALEPTIRLIRTELKRRSSHTDAEDTERRDAS